MARERLAHLGAPLEGARPGLLLVISGPSGVGKTSIVRDVLARFGGDFSVSATTRRPGPGEVDGRDYLFIDERAFQAMVDSDLFLEHAQVFGRNWYGTPREPVERAIAEGRIVALDIDVQGAEQVRARHPNAFCIFILPPSEQELLRRLRARGREDESAIMRRFAESTREIARAKSGSTYDAFVTNDDLGTATEAVCSLIAGRLARQ
ncbi:MAG: guanylate kinase [Phycisphaerales bacterium]|nr:guanylate kinase [Phycisphaerales bacterium]